ncbi:hypothetical protein V2W30_38930 [Streptomyces sp. Q6]|uniref:Uncharacterized protein n=1 Tax=Streptomyces citrinus TaxID=3118173 RepID=A0ACD5ANX2_9ACTN
MPLATRVTLLMLRGEITAAFLTSLRGRGGRRVFSRTWNESVPRDHL